MMLLGTVLLGLTAFSIGCGQSEEPANSGLSSLPLPELMASLTSEAGEFDFCLSEGAGIESLKGCAEKMKDILDALPDSVSASDLEKLVQSNAAPGDMSKANKKLRNQIERISKIVNK